jgi:hypothetical protein
MIIKTQKVDPRAEGGVRILIKESDRDESSLEKSLTDKVFKAIRGIWKRNKSFKEKKRKER